MIMDELCEEPTPTGYHSKDMVTIYASGESRPYDPESRNADSGLDMVTVDNGADEPATVLCGYHELRRHMARHAAERARLAAANVPCGGPGGWW